MDQKNMEISLKEKFVGKFFKIYIKETKYYFCEDYLFRESIYSLPGDTVTFKAEELNESKVLCVNVFEWTDEMHSKYMKILEENSFQLDKKYDMFIFEFIFLNFNGRKLYYDSFYENNKKSINKSFLKIFKEIK